MLSLADRVRAGATLLDLTVPGWYRRINIGTLNVQKDCDCICGQIYGGFIEGLRALFPEIRDIYSAVLHAEDYGFNSQIQGVCNDASLAANKQAYAELTQLWKVEVQERVMGYIRMDSQSFAQDKCNSRVGV